MCLPAVYMLSHTATKARSTPALIFKRYRLAVTAEETPSVTNAPSLQVGTKCAPLHLSQLGVIFHRQRVELIALSPDQLKVKVKVAHTRLPSVGFRS